MALTRTRRSPAEPRVAVSATAACLASLLAVTACGQDGSSGAATVTVTTTAAATTSSPPPATGQTGSRPRLRITHRIATDPGGLPLELPQFAVAASRADDPEAERAAAALQEALQAQVAAVVTDWEAAQEPGQPPAGGVSTEAVSVPVNELELAVVAWRSYLFTGGAHGLTLLRHVTVDVTQGTVVTGAALLEQLQRAGGPGWDFERELRAAVRRQLPDEPAVAGLTRQELHVYPERAGLHVTGDQCVLACALPPIDVTIPWHRLVGRDDDIAALPDSWGL
jgi:hypothetical protein